MADNLYILDKTGSSQSPVLLHVLAINPLEWQLPTIIPPPFHFDAKKKPEPMTGHIHP